MSAANSVFSNDGSISLDWADVSGANKYHVQVSLYPDFSVIMLEDSTLVSSAYSGVDSGTNDQKRYWRWRSSADAGATWTKWGQVGSYWLDSTGSTDVTLSSGTWALFDPDDVTDLYTFDCFPIYQVIGKSLYRVRDRNRLGEMLSEYVTNKAVIALKFPERNFVFHQQMREFARFHVEIKTFFLAAYKTNGIDNVPHIWKAQFTDDPDMEMIVAGREDLFSGTLQLEEV